VDKKKLKKYASVALKIAVSVAALVYVFNKIPFKDVVGVLTTAKVGYLFLALLLFIVSKSIAAFRLQYFFQKVDIHISDKSNLKLYLLGMFYNLFLPGGIGGDGYKIYKLTKGSEVKGKKVFGAVLMDRVSGVNALGILAAAMIPTIYNPWFPSIYALGLIPLFFLGLYLIFHLFYKYFIPVIGITTLYSLGVQFAQLVSAFFILKALGITESINVYLVLFLISSIATILPISFGGLGLREILFTFMVAYFPIHESPAVAFALSFYLITVLTSFFGIYYNFKEIKIEKA
jgi:uncharacterized membrane protein YbhN (UPF0104 family)